MSNRLALALSFGLVGVLLSSSGCMPVAQSPPKNTFDERDFAADPKKSARLDHIVAVHLEPTGTHLGDTGNAEGVDEIPYEITEPTWVSVGIPLYENHGHWIEWLDSQRSPLLLAHGTLASSTVLLEPGRYIARLHHVRPGVATDHVPTLFLRSMRNVVRKSDAARAQWTQPYSPGGEDPDDPDDNDFFCDNGDVSTDTDAEDYSESVTIMLTGDVSCVTFDGADFSNNFSGEEDKLYLLDFGDNARNAVFRNCKFDEAAIAGTLTDSQFINCSMTDVDWDYFSLTGNSTMTGCNLTSRVSLSALTLAGITLDGCSFAHTSFVADGPAPATDFQGSTFRNCDFTGVSFDSGNFSHVVGLFNATYNNNLTSATIVGANLSYVDFTGAHLAAVATDWSRVNFSHATFSNADLAGITLTGANFSDANLTGVVCHNNATLVGVTFTGATLSQADFSGSNLTQANLERVSASGANFQNAVMDQVIAHGAELSYANLAGVSLSAAQLGGAAGSGIVPATLSFAYMPNAKITNSADCRNVDFSYAHLYGDAASVQGAELTAANFSNAIISGMDFSGATLESCSFENAQAVGAKFIGANVTDAKFDSAYLMGADFTNAVATGAVFANAAISTGPCSDASGCSTCNDCEFSTLDPANLCCYSFSEADGTVYAVTFGATILPNDPSITCPDGNLGPCTGAKLVPRDHGPYPPVPPCVPSPFNWCTAPAQ